MFHAAIECLLNNTNGVLVGPLYSTGQWITEVHTAYQVCAVALFLAYRITQDLESAVCTADCRSLGIWTRSDHFDLLDSSNLNSDFALALDLHDPKWLQSLNPTDLNLTQWRLYLSGSVPDCHPLVPGSAPERNVGNMFHHLLYCLAVMPYVLSTKLNRGRQINLI